jgi:ferredoxin-NADP reductase
MPSLTTKRHKRAPKLAEVKVFRREDVTHDLWLIWIERPDGFAFKTGQYCTIGLDGVERPYSIVSAPHEDYLELFIELVPEPVGVLTPKLWSMGVGDSVTIRPRAKGLFTMDPRLPNQLFVSTVTGVVPYISIIRDYVHHERQGHRFYVLQGASYVDEFTYDRELHQLARERPELVTYVPTISRPTEERNKGWTGETGRVNTIVERCVEKFGLTPDTTLIYACGHPGMIEDVKEKMVPKGFHVDEERFWKDD